MFCPTGTVSSGTVLPLALGEAVVADDVTASCCEAVLHLWIADGNDGADLQEHVAHGDRWTLYASCILLKANLKTAIFVLVTVLERED